MLFGFSSKIVKADAFTDIWRVKRRSYSTSLQSHTHRPIVLLYKENMPVYRKRRGVHSLSLRLHGVMMKTVSYLQKETTNNPFDLFSGGDL